MRFTVSWHPRAQGQLATIWMEAANRRAINDAAARIDALLREDAHERGKPLGEGRVLVEMPLFVAFSVAEGDRKAQVLLVDRF